LSDDQICLYLNLATTKTRAAAGDIGWLTGTAGTTIQVGASTSQETQCMVIGSCIWIANNEDVDTDFQFAFLNRLGIRSYAKLKEHVEAHQTRLLPIHAGKFNITDGAKPGEKLLARMTGTANRAAAVFPAFALPDQPDGGCQTYSLTSASAPPVSGIVFVKGSYIGAGGENEHAEQKLMAALGKYLQGSGTSIYGKRLQVAGCKSACQTCRGVLQNIAGRLLVGISRTRLSFDDPELVDARNGVGMGPAHPSNIKALDVAHYFP
jgi:hypothetical protein